MSLEDDHTPPEKKKELLPKKKKRLSNIDTIRNFLLKKSMVVFPSRRTRGHSENKLFGNRELKKERSTKSILKVLAKFSQRTVAVSPVNRKQIATATVLQYPMFLINFSTLKKLYGDGTKKIESFQTLQKRGDLVKWSEDLEGEIIFVSHEWLAFNHPDPKSEQMRTLIRARTFFTSLDTNAQNHTSPPHS